MHLYATYRWLLPFILLITIQRADSDVEACSDYISASRSRQAAPYYALQADSGLLYLRGGGRHRGRREQDKKCAISPSQSSPLDSRMRAGEDVETDELEEGNHYLYKRRSGRVETVRFVSWSHPSMHETRRCIISARGKCKSVEPHLLCSAGIDRQTTTPTPGRERGKREFGASEWQAREQEPTTPHALLATMRGGNGDCSSLSSPTSSWETALAHLRLSREEEREVVEEAESEIGGVGEQFNRSKKMDQGGLFQSVLLGGVAAASSGEGGCGSRVECLGEDSEKGTVGGGGHDVREQLKARLLEKLKNKSKSTKAAR